MSKKQSTKQDILNRIRTDGPSEKDLTDDRPRVRRAALVKMAQSDGHVDRIEAMYRAQRDPSDVVYLSTMRGYLIGGAACLAMYPGAMIDG